MTCRPCSTSFLVRSTGLVALALASVVARAQAQETPPAKPEARPDAGATSVTSASGPGLEMLMPADSLFFVGVDNLDLLRADWAASPWGRLYADPANEALRASFSRLLTELRTTSSKESGVDVVEAFQWITGRLGFGFSGDLGAKNGVDWNYTVGAESPEHVGELRDLGQKLLEKENEKGRLVLKHETDGDVEVTVAVHKEEDATGAPDLRIGASGPLLLVDVADGTYREKSNFRSALAVLRGEGKESLATSGLFKESIAAKSGGVKLWFDLGKAVRAQSATAKDREGDIDAKFQETLGLNELGALSSRFELNAKEMRIEALLAWTGKGMLARMLTSWLAGSDSSLLSLVPADVEHALSLHLDFGKGMAAVTDFKKEMGLADEAPPPGADPAAGGDAAAGAEAPLDPSKDFMDHLDGRIALFAGKVDASEALPFGGEATPMSFCVVVGVKSVEPLTASLERLLRSMGMHAMRKKSEFQGFQIYSLPIMPVTVHYAILPDVAVISLSPTLLQDVLRRKSDKELKSLSADAGFKRELDGISPGASLLVWSKIDPGVFATLAAPFGPGSPFSEPPGAEGEGARDPVLRELMTFMKALGAIDPAVAAKHLPAGSVIGLGVDANGIRLEGVSR